MFLFERIFGFSTYMLMLLFVCILLAKTNASCKGVLRFYICCLCVMAFFYKPYITGDLYRIYETMDFFAEMDFLYFWENYARDTSIPLARLLFWCIAKTGVNSILPAFSAFVCYSFIFYIINRTQKIFSVSKKNTACVLFLVMTTSVYISVIGGIRMMLALSMITFSYFRNTVEKRIKLFDIGLYVISIFLHSMSMVVLGICAGVTLFNAKRNYIRRIGFALAIGAFGFIIIHNFSDVVNGFYQKFYDYVLGDRHSDRWEYIMGCLIIALLILLMYEFRFIRKDDACLRLKSYNAATLCCVAIAICFCFEFSIFYRFGGQLAVIFGIPMLMVTLEKTSGRPSRVLKKIDFKAAMILISMMIAVISCTRGSLSSLKFFEL